VSYRDFGNDQSTLHIAPERRSIPAVPQKLVETAFGAFLIVDANAWPSPRRSWPGPMSRLERLGERAGIDADELRASLHWQIQVRLRERGLAWETLDRVIEKRANGR
jgi:hypothetical protein